MGVHIHLSAGSHVYLTDSRPILDALATVQSTVNTLSSQVLHMDSATQASLDDLLANVAIASTVETSIETLLTGLSDQITKLATSQSDPAVVAAIQQAAALVAAVNARAQTAVIAHTPATPTP
jgi:hypothetical protein